MITAKEETVGGGFSESDFSKSQFGKGLLQRELSDNEALVLSWLDKGAMPLSKIEERATKADISQATLYRIKDAFKILTITGSNGTFWLRSVDVNFNKRFVVEEDEARLVELPEVEYYAWKQDFRKSLRRPPTQKEIEERRAQQVDDVKKTLLGIRVKINELSTTGVQLSPAEIDLLPDVADFISRHASEFGTTEFPVVARAQKMLDQHRAKHMDDVRPLTPEEIQAGRAILDAQITKAEAALKEAQQYVPPYISTWTWTEHGEYTSKIEAARERERTKLTTSEVNPFL